jgi:hypothetical protein
MCDTNVKNLIARVFKNETLDLDPGQHFFDETVTLHISGSVKKQSDQMVAPTASLPVIPVLALFWEKCGVSRDHALRMLREAITEAMQNGKNKDERIEARIKDVEKAVETVKKDLIAKLPKQKRAGRVVVKDLHIAVLNEEAAPAAA